jgi:hypothetical protein
MFSVMYATRWGKKYMSWDYKVIKRHFSAIPYILLSPLELVLHAVVLIPHPILFCLYLVNDGLFFPHKKLFLFIYLWYLIVDSLELLLSELIILCDLSSNGLLPILLLFDLLLNGLYLRLELLNRTCLGVYDLLLIIDKSHELLTIRKMLGFNLSLQLWSHVTTYFSCD